MGVVLKKAEVIDLPVLSIETLEEKQDEVEIELWDWIMAKQDQGYPELFIVGVMEKVKHQIFTIFEEDGE